MGRRTRGFALAGAGLLTAAAPVVLTQEPAGAASNHDDRSASLTFVALDGSGVTCTLYNQSSHDTTRRTATVNGTADGAPQCFDGDTYFAITISAKDEDGVTRSTSGNTFSTYGLAMQLDHAVSAVHTSVRVYFGQCNASSSASCELTVTASPK